MSLIALALAAAVQTPNPAAGRAPLDCAFAHADGEMSTIHNCAWKDADGQVHFSQRRLEQMAYDQHGLASVFVGSWRYVARDGRSAAVVTFDNGPDAFADGLARTPLAKKIGYIDRNLRTVIPARFDGAYPFENGLAVVCNGCRVVSDREYSSYADGNWGCIDRHGRFAVALHPARAYVSCSRSSN